MTAETVSIPASSPDRVSGIQDVSPSLAVGRAYTRLPQLDLLRGISILTVLLHHFVVPPEHAGVFQHIAKKFAWSGWIGVDLFFVLSGFLIGGLLFEELKRTGSLNARRFLIRRAFKIWPAYFSLLIGAWLWAWITGEFASAGIVPFLPNLLHLQNYLQMPADLEHTWSLAVEEHFYLALTLGLALVLRFATLARIDAWFLWAAVSLLAAVLLCRIATALAMPQAPFAEFYQTHLRIDALLAGVILAFVKSFRPHRFVALLRWRPLLAAIAVFALIPAWTMGRDSAFLRTYGLSANYFFGGCVLLLVLGITPGHGIAGKILVSPPIRLVGWIGTISYAIYLWHYCFAAALVRTAAPAFADFSPSFQWAVITALYISIAVAFGAFGTWMVERRFLLLRDRLFPSTRSSIRSFS